MTEEAINTKYKGTISLIMPGYTKATSYPVMVEAVDPTEATEKILLAWNKATQARNISIEEITP